MNAFDQAAAASVRRLGVNSGFGHAAWTDRTIGAIFDLLTAIEGRLTAIEDRLAAVEEKQNENSA
jgi:hypothetical protein